MSVVCTACHGRHRVSDCENKVSLKRSDAVSLLEKIRRLCHADQALEPVADVLREAGIPKLEPCTGEAHSNPHIDNCGLCAPRWGVVGKFLEVR